MSVEATVFLGLAGGLALGVLLFFFSRLKTRGKRVEAEIRHEYGDRIRLINGCGVIRGLNRVPGIVALLDDRVIYRAVMLDYSADIPLDQITRFWVQEAATCPRPRAHKHRRAAAMLIQPSTGEEHLLVVAQQHAETWETALVQATGIQPEVP